MPFSLTTLTAMPEYWSNLVKDIGALLGMLIAFSTVVYGAARFTSRGFGRAVTTHVKPLVDTLSESLNNVALTVKDVQREHATTTERLVQDLQMKRDILSEHGERLSATEETVADHETRISVVEANPALQEVRPKPARRRS